MENYAWGADVGQRVAVFTYKAQGTGAVWGLGSPTLGDPQSYMNGNSRAYAVQVPQGGTDL